MISTKGAEIKSYRVKATFGFGIVLSAVFLIVGISGIIPGNGTGASGAVVSSLSVIFAVWLGAISVTSGRLMISSKGLTYWVRLKRNTVPWSSVKSFKVGISRSMVHWPCLIIATDRGDVRVDGVAGTRRSIEALVQELTNAAAVRNSQDALT